MEATTPPSDSPSIKPINKSVVHRICAGQVILDLSAAVKELVENSLDAGATSIEIALKDYGKEWFQVIDNGSGISPCNFNVLALKHHTSKLAGFPDLQSLTTFGFRGEALSSLCALGNLTVETRTKYEQVATHLTFDHSGVLVAEKKTARQVGTTVTVKNLFVNLPVRCKEFSRNIRKEFGKLISLLNAYAVIAKGVRLVCMNAVGRNAKSVVLKTQGSGSLKDNIVTLFGMSTFSCLEPVSISVSDSCKVAGFLSKSGQGSGRNMGDRQFFFVNGRPVDMPKVTKLVNELYRGANSQQHPIAILNFTVPTTACDVNVTPDKRKVFFSDESSILAALREGLQQIYSPSSARYSVNKVEEPTKEAGSSQLCSPHAGSRKQLTRDNDDVDDVFEEVCPVDKAEAPIKEGSMSEFCFPGHRSHKFLKQSPVDSVPKEVSPEDHSPEGDGPLKAVETNSEPTHNEEGFRHENSAGKDFALRVHNIKKFHVTSQLTNNLSSMKADRNSANEDSCSHSSSVQASINQFVTVTKRKHDSISTVLSEMPVLRNQSLHCQSKNDLPDAVDKAEAPIKEGGMSEFCFPGHRSHKFLKQSPVDSVPKEVSPEDHSPEGDGPLKAVETNSEPTHNEEGFSHENSAGKDFALRVHNIKKFHVTSQLTNNLSSMKADRNSANEDSCSHSSSVQASINQFVTVTKRKHDSISTVLSEMPVLRNQSLHCQSKNDLPDAVSKPPFGDQRIDDCTEDDNSAEAGVKPSKYFRADRILNKIRIPVSPRGKTEGEECGEVLQAQEEAMPIASPSRDISLSEDLPSASPSSCTFLGTPKPSSGLMMCPTLRFDIQDLKTRRQQILSRLQPSTPGVKPQRCYTAATLELSQPDNEERKARALAAATTELERLFRKEDFGRMKVIGQFNLGFIIGKLDQDLFIVDQHAADEKYNFERLSQSTILNQQPLLRPLRLELSPEEEVVASMHSDIIRKNGFSLEEDPDAPPGHHFKLKAVPFSKNITFGAEDVKDLISTLADSHGECSIIGSYKMDTVDSVCPSRVRAMLASRACRSSVVIGDALGRNEMRKILEHLAGLKSPWNCPHGRPTMRHLIDLKTIHRSEENDDAES